MNNEKIKVIAISGFKGSGKDTIARMIEEYMYEQNNIQEAKNDDMPHRPATNIVRVFSMAKPIRDIVETAFSLKEPEYGKKEENNELWSKRLNHNVSYRDFVNTIGTTMRKLYGNKIWVWKAETELEDFRKNIEFNKQFFKTNIHGIFVIPDIRYKQEIKMLQRLKKDYDVEHWLVLRKECLPEWARMGLRVTDPVERKIILKDFKPSIHESDWCLANPKFSRVIVNDGTYEELVEKVFAAMSDK